MTTELPSNTPHHPTDENASVTTNTQDASHAAAVAAAAAANADSFERFNLPAALSASLKKMNFTSPTPIQAGAIPPGLEGKDILGSAQTGTGKTAAFSIPLVARLLSNPRGSALVMTPTRELAVQVIDVITQLLGKYTTINTALLIGGESMPKQFQQLKARPRVIVGTPGRINDHLERGTLMLHDTCMLVLDETDRMLDMGFGVQIDRVLKFVPPTRQTMLFSATIPPQIAKMSEKYLRNPVRVSMGQVNATATKIKQELIHVSESGKFDELVKQLESRTGSIIIFVKTKFGAERMAHRLSKMGHSADAIHGDLQQRKRDKVIAAYRDMNFRILVATDIASRGLDIPHIEHVINYDLPQVAEDYIHRIGRTARADAEGHAVSFLSSEDRLKWCAIERLLDPKATVETSGTPSNEGGARRSGGGGYRGGNKGSTGGGNRNAPNARHRSAKFGEPKRRSGGFGHGGGSEGGSSEGGQGQHRGGHSSAPRSAEGGHQGGDRPQRSERPHRGPSEGGRPEGGNANGGGAKRPFNNRRPRKAGGDFRRPAPNAA